ncbi:acylneuraminate cytidylyltransferase family protein [Halonotius pteroides]|uniref:Flagellar modification protein B n=1 Tax=Halonotius pteroides TaxID=268735 RepID=A0A3A6PXI7_9EURY|nr:acylneuraminate cytidylyltransferase family protein [Halonotius pteroides]RJX47964.1 flagellar modification protein B [Halonotius pteroides]
MSNDLVLCTICARGGSKGVPNKNIRTVAGKPLIAHTIEHALDWNRSTDVVVSTDSTEIAEVAEQYGAEVPFLRPEQLASDSAAKLPVIQHVHQYMTEETDTDYDYIVDLDATAPLRKIEDIKNCFQVLQNSDSHNVYTVTEADKNPYFNMVELDQDGCASLSKQAQSEIVRRQDAPDVYAMNASVYIWEQGHLQGTDSIHQERTRISVMPPERSVDIDRPIDLAFVEFLFENESEYV